MTKEEAIMILKNEQPHCGKRALFPEEKKYEAYDMAIKALEQQTCEDAVSRKDVLNLVDNLNDGSFRWASIRTKIARLHFVQPELKPCEDAVSRSQVLELFVQNADAVRPYSKTWEEVKDLPPVNPQQRVGHWIYTGDYLTEGMLKCSECGEEIDVSESYYNFCPACGAKMVEPQESEVEE